MKVNAIYLLGAFVVVLALTAWLMQQTPPPAPVRTADVTLTKLRAIALQASDVPIMITQPTDWWPAWPELYRPGMYPDPLPGEQGYIITRFRHVTNQDECLECTLTLYAGEEYARSGFRKLTAQPGFRQPCAPAQLRNMDECRYLAKKQEKLFASTLRFRTGELVCRLTLLSADAYRTPTQLLQGAQPIAARMAQAENGETTVPVIPPSQLALFPTDIAAQAEVVETLQLPVDAWALMETTGTPQDMRTLLRRGGVEALLYRSYRSHTLPQHRIELTLFPFDQPTAAAAWVKRSLRPGEPAALPTGAVVPPPVWLHHYGGEDEVGGLYEYQFAHGRYVCDVSVSAPFKTTDPAAAAQARTLAEHWYRALTKR